MSMKQFVIATLFFMVVALGAIAGITFALGKFLMPPSAFDGFVTRLLGDRGALVVILVAYLLGIGLAYLLTKKFLIRRFQQKGA